MPIHRRSRSLTEGPAALALFTDRQYACRRFAAYLDGEQPLSTVLFFYGDGGNGKSLLLQFLYEYYCLGRDPRRWADHQPTDATPRRASIPTALLDFTPSGSDESHQRAISGLLRLRRSLGAYQLQFPLFDYASILYLKQTEGLPDDRIRALFPAEEADLIAALLDMLSSSTYGAIGKAILGLFSKHLGRRPNEWFTLWLQRRSITADDLDALQRLDPLRELLQELPHLFAEDLNTAMLAPDAPPRVVLLFDTHEAFWGGQRDLQGERYFVRDEWLRCLLATLDRQLGIVTVVAGREPPRWSQAERCPISARAIEIQPITHFSADDARAYLGHAEITDEALCRILLDYVHITVGEVHPLYLGLCTDIVRAAAAQGTPITPDALAHDDQFADKGAVLLNRLLRYTDNEVRGAVEILSAARAFNRDLYLNLGQALAFTATRPAFATLTQFSFVWQARERGDDWYRIHPLVQRVLAADSARTSMLTEAHAALEQNYRQRVAAGERTAVAEAIYHANQQDWERGIAEWIASFDQALQLSDYRQCATLLEVRSDLRIGVGSQRGQVLELEGRYYATLARWEIANRQYRDAIAVYEAELQRTPDDLDVLNHKGNALYGLGEVLRDLAQYQQAQQVYEQAIAAHDAVLLRAPDADYAYNDKGNALQGLGDLLHDLAQYEQAQQVYEQAIAAYDATLLHAPDAVAALNNKGNVLEGLGDLLRDLAQYEQAQQVYEQAIAAFDAVLLHAPDHPEACDNKCVALAGLGEVLRDLAQYQQAQQVYEQAIAAYDATLLHAPDHVNAHSNKGVALRNLGDVLRDLAQYERAQQVYEQAIVAFDVALLRAPDHVNAHNNKGNALHRLGDLLRHLAQPEQARQAYEQATVAYDAALLRAPDAVYAHKNKGVALMSLGEVLRDLAQYEQAQQVYEQAIAAFDAVLLRTPDHPEAHDNKGVALAGLGEVLRDLEQHEQAQQVYEQAIAAYDAALLRAPDAVAAHNNKGNVLEDLGDLLRDLEQYEQAQQVYERAIAAFDAVLLRTPDHPEARDNKCVALVGLGDVLRHLAQYEQAQQVYEQVITAYDATIVHTPDNSGTHNNKGCALMNLGDLLREQAQYKQAQHAYEQAIAAFDAALLGASDYAAAYNNKGLALHRLGNLLPEQAQQLYEQAIAAFDAALLRVPDHREAYTNKGFALYGLGEVLRSQGQPEQAQQMYEQAIAAYEAAILHAPDYANAHNNKGQALCSLGEVLRDLAQPEQAQQAYKQAIASFDATLLRAPDAVNFHINKGIALQRLATLSKETNATSQAINLLQEAIICWNHSLTLAPDDQRLRVELDHAQQRLDKWTRDNTLLDPIGQKAIDPLLIKQALAEFATLRDSNELLAFWEQLPSELEDDFITAVEAQIVQAEQSGESDLAAGLRQRLDGLHQLQAAQTPREDSHSFRQALDRYLELCQAAKQVGPDVFAWQTAIEAGEVLLASEFADDPGANWDALRENLASAYNSLANALHYSGDELAAIDAYDRAVTLQPDFALWRRNRAGALINLGRLDEAGDEIAAARVLEPNEPQLAELDQALGLAPFLATFLTVANSRALAEFWPQVPASLKGAFIATVETQIAQAERDGNIALAEAWAARLAGVRQLQAAKRMPTSERDNVEQALIAFLNARTEIELRRLLSDHPSLLSEEVVPLFAALLDQYADDEEVLTQIETRRALLQEVREKGVEPVFAQITEQEQQLRPFLQALDHYLDLQSAAEADVQNIVAWQEAATAGEALLAPPLNAAPGVDFEALRADIASVYCQLGRALEATGGHQAVLATFERACALQPDFAMGHRNRADALIKLQRLDEAEAAITLARQLEPEAARLAELDTELAQARQELDKPITGEE